MRCQTKTGELTHFLRRMFLLSRVLGTNSRWFVKEKNKALRLKLKKNHRKLYE